MAFTFVARWFVRPEKKSEFIAVVQEFAANIPPSIYETNIYINVCWNRRGEFIACESWKDEDAVNTLRKSPLFHEAIRKMTGCCSRPLELEVLDALDGDGGVFERYPLGKADPRYYPNLGEMTATVA